ncbi:MAG: hypothetical protein NTU98_02940 [Bacteroidetes bacterium]|nr:hypothetical protein [Bacteroidota bacterium]
MKPRNLFYRFIKLAILIAIFSSCVKHDSLEVTVYQYSNVILTFSHQVKGASLKFDTMLYRTSLGNQYQVSDLQYFISGVYFHQAKGKWQEISTDKGIHYTDARDNYSCSWWLKDQIQAGEYDSIAFTFGLDEKQNFSGRFTDPPERDMFWPDLLGGGYHYMKLNLKWKNDTMVQPLPFMFHLGIGQVYAGNTVNTDSIIGFVQNYFKVILPCKMTLKSGGYHQVMLQMDIARWFDGENAFDFAAYPNGIMQNQDGMYRACLNGRKAFDVIIPK